MSANRPYVLSIAGFDPSGGAGILADIKTFEQHQAYGLSVITANTIQTENQFHKIVWVELDFVLKSIQTLLKSYPVKAVKIGIVPSLDYLKSIVLTIRELVPFIPIVWDTVLKSTTKFAFLDIEMKSELIEVLKQIDLVTPNLVEAKMLFSEPFFENVPCSVLLKGGHNNENQGVDYLFHNDKVFKYEPSYGKYISKHGSGCVLSSAVTAQLALDKNMTDACEKAKRYIESFLESNSTQLGYHYV